MSSRSKVSDGDWICSDSKCSNMNFARRNSCNRCGKEKSILDIKSKKQGIEIGKAAAEKSHGLFSADDWQCTKCGNVNWARRSTCNMCNAPKVGETEERTGYGGGFNEREGVEYVKREDSDDEFDEFGRRRKKTKSQNSGIPEKPPQILKPAITDEEEEDDDDEDGDLSKYQLFDDDDLSDTNEDKKSESEGSSNRSRSSSSSSYSSHSSSSSSGKSRSRSSSRQDRSRSPERRHARSTSRSKKRDRSRSRSSSRDRKYTKYS